MSSGQTINDRILAARFSIAGQGLAKSVCKATTEEVNGPKKKHLDYLLHCTNEPNVSIPQLANLLIERSQNTSWVVVFKALVTVHHLMCYGNERFTQYLASSNCNFQLGNFLDKSGVAAPGGYDMSPFIRRYAKYLNEKALAYRTVAFDFCKVKRGKEDGTLRTMQTDKLLKTLPVLQSHLDALLEFDCSSNELTNGVINTAFMLLFRDLIRLFACYNDGIINLLEKYFDMNKKQCREALDIYKRFLVRMDRVAEFLKVAETVGVEKSDIPELSKAPSSLLEALEAHLASLEGKKPNSSSTTNVSAVGGANGEAAPGIDENLKRQALAEEEAAMSQFKKNTNPFLSSPTTSNPPAQAPTSSQAQTQSIVDLFAADIDAKAAQTNAPRTSDDLLQLAANPFAAPPIPPLPTVSAPATAWGMNPMQNGYGAAPSGAFATDNAFAAAFGVPASSTTNGFDAFGDLLQPNINGNVTATVKPNVAAVPANTAAASRVLTGDLDSCLANLADNLTIQKSPQNIPANKGMQWSNAGAGLPRQPIPNQGPSPQPQQWGAPMMPAQMGVSSGMPFMSMNQPTMPYQTAPMNMNMNMMGSVPMRPSQMMASQGGMMFPTQQPPQAMGMPAQIRPAATSTQALDPFGAL